MKSGTAELMDLFIRITREFSALEQEAFARLNSLQAQLNSLAFDLERLPIEPAPGRRQFHQISAIDRSGRMFALFGVGVAFQPDLGNTYSLNASVLVSVRKDGDRWLGTVESDEQLFDLDSQLAEFRERFKQEMHSKVRAEALDHIFSN